MVALKYWKLAYATLMVCGLAGLVVVAVTGGFSLLSDAIAEFNLGWLLAFSQIIGLLLLFTLLERWWPAGPAKPLRGWMLNIQIVLFGSLVAPFTGAVLGASIGHLSESIGLGLIDLRLGQANAATLVITFGSSVLIFDFLYYWLHRFQHESAILWQQHKLHHMDEQLSATTVTRDHWLEGVVHAATIGIPLAVLFELDPVTGGVFGGALMMLRFIWLVFIHANLRIGFGRANRVLTSPQLHRIHHSRLLEHRDKNFAAYFPIWDVLFGTYFHPKKDEYPATGVHNEKDVSNVVEAIILPFREWWKMFREWRRHGANTSLAA